MTTRKNAFSIPSLVLAGGILVALASLWIGYVSAENNEGPIGDVSFSFQLEDMEWPAVGADVVGYKFDASAIAALNSASVKGTSTTWELLPSAVPLSLHGDYCASSGYRAAVTRTITLDTHDAKECKVAISVFPSATAAQRHFVDHFSGRAAIANFLNVATTQSGCGDVCFIMDAEIEIDSSGRGQHAVHKRWKLAMSRELYAFYYNVYIHISIDRNSKLGAFAVLTDIIAEMDAQRVAASGNPEYPDVSLVLDAATVQAAPLPGAEVDVTHSAEWSEEPCAKRFFMAGRVANHTWNATTEDYEPDAQNPFTYIRGSSSYLDNAENPTRVKGLTKLSVGHYHVVMVAWGDNLLPKVIYKPLEVTIKD